MDSAIPPTQPRAHKAKLCHCQLFSIPLCRSFSLCLSICLCRLLPLSYAYVWVAIHQGHWISALDIWCLLHFRGKGSAPASWQLENMKVFLFGIPIKIPASFILYRFRACRHSNTSCRLLWPVTSLPGGARGRVHCEEQAGDTDLPLHPCHADLLQVQRRVGSPGWPHDWPDSWPSIRYMQNKLKYIYFNLGSNGGPSRHFSSWDEQCFHLLLDVVCCGCVTCATP